MNTKRTKAKSRPYAQTARAQSAEATARRIVEAFLERLMTQWFDEITLDKVAHEAGVTVQTVIRRFGSKEGLLAEAVKVMGVQISAQRAAPSGDIDRLVRHLMEDYERTGDAVLRLLALEPRYPDLKPILDYGRGEHRKWVSYGFVDSLKKSKGAARERAIDKLVVVTDVYTWKLLRRDLQRSKPVTENTIKSLITVAIADGREFSPIREVRHA
jgi:AcrR family transcriptional regulator